MSSAEMVQPDGRHARRDRNRDAVIDAMFELMAEGVRPLAAEAIAERAGVSASSIFRYFDGLHDLQQQTIERHMEQSGHLFEVRCIGEGSIDERIVNFVESRLTLYDSIAPVARVARSRAPEHPPLARQLANVRTRFRSQIRSHFGPEVESRPPGAAADLVDLLDALTSFEAWDLLRSGAGRSRARIRRAWVTGIGALTG